MSRFQLIWRKSLNVLMLTLTGVACFCRSRGPLLHPGLLYLQRRKGPQLGFLHSVAETGGRDGRRHGQCDRRQS